MALYDITAPRSTLALYLAAEYGPARANQLMKASWHKPGGLWQLPCTIWLHGLQKFINGTRAFKTKREAEAMAAKIRWLAAYQQGRLKKRLTDPLVIVTRIR